MARTSVIRIKAVIEIPFQRHVFGATTVAEAHCNGIRKAIEQVLADATLVSWDAQHTSVAAHEGEPVASVAPAAPDDVGEMPAYLRRGGKP